MSWRTALAVAALVLPAPPASGGASQGNASRPASAAPEGAARAVHAAIPQSAEDAGGARESPSRSLAPFETWSGSSDARALAHDGAFVWVATGGGLDRYARATRERRHYGVADGLDTLDVRTVEATPAGLVVRTATGRCAMTGERLACAPCGPPAAAVTGKETLAGRPVNTRLRVGADTWVATRGAGVRFLPGGDEARAVALGDVGAPASFVHTGAVFAGALWLGTFRDGLYRVPLDAEGRPKRPLAATAAPVKGTTRLVNRLVATTGKDAALYVGASDGLYATRDGRSFKRVPALAPVAVTGLATDGRHLWIAGADALHRLPASGRGRVERTIVRPGGSRAIQAVAVDDHGTVWLATEDRGVVRVDADGTTRVLDRLAGLPSSWFVAVAAGGNGGVVAASLRHGSVHIAQDGSWSRIAWAPNPWGLGVHRDATRTCLATQGGAACEADGERTSLALLPDARVHMLLPVGDALLAGTEAGLAVYPLGPAAPQGPVLASTTSGTDRYRR